jgi:hypothetical protein
MAADYRHAFHLKPEKIVHLQRIYRLISSRLTVAMDRVLILQNQRLIRIQEIADFSLQGFVGLMV